MALVDKYSKEELCEHNILLVSSCRRNLTRDYFLSVLRASDRQRVRTPLELASERPDIFQS